MLKRAQNVILMINEIYPRKLTQLTYITFTTFVSIVSYLEQTFFSRKYFDVFISVGGYPDNCPPRKNASRLGLGFWGFPFSQIFFFFICSNKSKFLRGESNIDFSMHKVIMTLGSGGEGVGGYHFWRFEI